MLVVARKDTPSCSEHVSFSPFIVDSSKLKNVYITAWPTWPHWRFRWFRTLWPAYTKRKYRLVITPYEPCTLSTKC